MDMYRQPENCDCFTCGVGSCTTERSKIPNLTRQAKNARSRMLNAFWPVICGWQKHLSDGVFKWFEYKVGLFAC